MMKVLSVVCARAGSKGLKNKCIARVGKKMVVEYALDYSLSLGDNVKTLVSTDIEELIAYCEYNHIRYIHRDPNFCTDTSRIDDALAEAIQHYGDDCPFCNLVYGNIPTRYPDIFFKAFRFLIDHPDYDAVLSMQNVEKFHPDWMFEYNEDVLPCKPEVHYQRQNIPQKMIHDGHTLLFRSREFYQRYTGKLAYETNYLYSIFGAKIKPLLVSDLVIDIDTAKELKLAQAVLQNMP